MAKITFLGGDEAVLGNIGYVEWPVGPAGNQTNIVFPLNKPIEVKNPHVIAKIRGQLDKGWWKIEEDHPAEAGHGARSAAGDSDEGESDESSHGTLKGARQRKIT